MTSTTRSRNTVGTAPAVAYLGWHGLGNLGDDAIYDAVRSQLPGADFLDMPRFPHEIVRAFATGKYPSLRRSPQVLGGGTLVGRRDWRRWASRGMALTRSNGTFAIGVGVEDPVFVGRRSGSAKDELTRWAPFLSKFHTVSVRGPRSAELLADVGLDVSVSGDPALLLPSPDATAQDGVIGVNLGFGDDLWGHDPQQVVTAMSAAARELSSQGYRLVGILMNSSDRRWTEAALRDTSADIIAPADAHAAATEFARCSAVVVSRLHAGILASLSGTPTVSLEYQPKCRDFARSIDNEELLIRTDALTGAAIVEKVGGALADSPDIRTKTLAAVAGLRPRLQAEYAVLASELNLDNA